jgi:4-hydroxybenzoate polyprenyltransferase
MLTSGWAVTLPAYVRERILGIPVLAAVVLVCACVQLTARHAPLEVFADGLTAFLLVAQFRLRDDLADGDRDRTAHPERVLVRAPSIAPFVAAVIALTAGNAAIAAARFGPGVAMGALIALGVLLEIRYRRLRRRSALADHIVLLKYPAFVVIVAGAAAAASVTGVLGLAFVYAAALVYEAAHDARADFGRRLRIVEQALLVTIGTALVLSSYVR